MDPIDFREIGKFISEDRLYLKYLWERRRKPLYGDLRAIIGIDLFLGKYCYQFYLEEEVVSSNFGNILP
jgi:hypothetical protein